MNAKRLLALAEFLETKVPRKRFDYNQWVGSDWGGKSDLSCGTVACAIGWAPQVPMLKRVGARLVENPWGLTPLIVPGYGCSPLYPATAAEVMFAINDGDVGWLFQPRDGHEAKATPKQVAKKIRRFVAARLKEEKAARATP